MVTLPRLVIAAPASGHGKTTIATGLMAALRATGLVVSGHKVGPDYIDPGYHSLATGRPGRNLDPHLVGEHRLVPLLLHGAAGADVAVIEGVMGLYDGQIGGRGFASTAHVATVTSSPVVLVVDVSHASRSIGAVVRGMADFDPAVEIVGVILNKVGTARHAAEVEASIDLPVLGVLHRDDGIVAPSRHLGLVPAQERDEAAHALDRLTQRITERVDLARVLELAKAAPDLDETPWDPRLEVSATTGARPVVAVAGGRAFTFRYAETEELLRAAGCDVVTFDPLTDHALPTATAGIYLGGGFPEVHAAGLVANAALREDLRAAVAAGIPTVAECAGLLYLCESVDGAPMIGSLPARADMTPRLTLSYRRADAPGDTMLTRVGEQVTGHEFHRTQVSPATSELPAWVVDGQPVGFASDTLHASYLHTHWAGHPQLAQRFADAVHAAAPHVSAVSTPPATDALSPVALLADPLRHHGDAEGGVGLVDFAVNVYDGSRPPWLREALLASLDEIGDYPSPTRAEHALAQRHGRAADDVLATAGAAEAFALVARLRLWRHPVVVHPQFTEPDVALLEAGHRPHHLTCSSPDFRLDPDQVPEQADLVILGNPTNPTGVLHAADLVRALLRPGRLVVVDEAFMDFVPAERHSLAEAFLPGLLVVRSLTKLWSIPGVRAGYVLGVPDLVRELRAKQTPWSVSATAAAAMIACSGPDATIEQATRVTRTATHRAILIDGLRELGLPFVDSQAPFVLARAGVGVHERLREAGYAVRRADTFPGLGPEWIRIAVRDPATTRKLLVALRCLGHFGR
ncbi:Cobyrinic acid a,c-diamide synthase [metagenome]|uniref:Cobyrinic acid a,c-diamide synthase n=1 Tax=metagenome TaxID=256318 RepID=A0A2P2C4W2_9ZZZZ